MDGMNGHLIDVVALMRTPEAKAAVTNALGASAAVHSQVGPLATFRGPMPDANRGGVLLVDVDPENDSELAVLETMLASQPTSVVVTAKNLTLDGMRRLMRIGIHDVVPQPIQSSDLLHALRGAIDRGRATLRPAIERGIVVCVMKGGGGVGATSIAVQGACELAARRSGGKRSNPDLCLLDLDLQFGTAALHLDLEPTISLMDLLNAPDRLDGSLLRGAMLHHESGVDVLASPVTIHPLDSVDPAAIARLIAAAREEYRHVIVDLPQAWTYWTRSVLETASVILLVTQLTVPALRQARRQIAMLAHEGLEGIPVMVAANRVETGWFRKGIGLKEAEDALGRPIDHAIPDGRRDFTAAINAGAALRTIRGGRTLARAIARTVEQVLERGRTPVAPHAG
jgi:pilus assembly protein CpaE